MKVGVLSDIHGNHIALQAVLAEAQRQSVERLFILGDLVGYYYHPDRVLELLEPWQKEMIQGNHEAMLLDALTSQQRAEEIRKKYGSGIDMALRVLPSAAIASLTKLPWRKTVRVDGLVVELCHGSPWDRDTYIYPNAPREILNKCRLPGTDFIFMGHTHHPFISDEEGCCIANSGSVGQARDKGGVANWLMLDTASKALTLQKTPYEISELLEEVQQRDPHLPYLGQVLKR